MSDLIIRNCNLGNSDSKDIFIKNGLIEDITNNIPKIGCPEIDAKNYFVTSPFVDSHFHMDATLSYGLPRVNQSGTLLEGIQLWGELKPTLTKDAIKNRARKLCKWAIARGTLIIRSHVDVSGDNLLAVEALLEIKDEMKEYIELQLVAFPQDGLLRSNCHKNLIKSLDMGVDVVGGIPHFERTMDEGSESIKILCELAEKRNLLVDMHCDESDDPNSRHIETLTLHTNRLNMNGRVAGSHLTSMHSMDNYYFSKLIGLMVEAEMNVIPNPLINITIQGKHDTYPKRRGMTRVPEQIKAGLNVAFGHDCVMDPWYPLGSHDMLEVAHMALHVAHMTGVNEMVSCFDSVTTTAAKVLHIEKYGLKKGSYGDLVILQCKNKIEALRLKPTRLFVIKKGTVISSSNPTEYKLQINSKPEFTDLIF